MDYFEGQNKRDCVIHSLNNAFGAEVVTKDEVLGTIEDRVQRLVEDLQRRGTPKAQIDQKVRAMRNRYSSGETFFAADVVWDTARDKGAFASYVPVPGVASPFLRMSSFTPLVLRHPIVVLGGVGRKNTHAIAIRGSMIYDSERDREGPVPLNKEQLRKSLSKVFGAYVFLRDPSMAREIREQSNIFHEM